MECLDLFTFGCVGQVCQCEPITYEACGPPFLILNSANPACTVEVDSKVRNDKNCSTACAAKHIAFVGSLLCMDGILLPDTSLHFQCYGPVLSLLWVGEEKRGFTWRVLGWADPLPPFN